MRMNRVVLLVTGILVAVASQTNCSSSDDNSTGKGGSGGSLIGTDGGSTGQAGSAAGSTGAAGAAPAAFMSLKPCDAESAYMTGTMIQFPDPSSGEFAYSPKCLKVTAGTTVTFAGEFSGHPLVKSTRGDADKSPIMSKSSGSSTTVTFSMRGFYPYYCGFHGSDSGVGMSGVVWVQ